MRGTGGWRGVVLMVLLFLGAWPAVAHAQGDLVVEPGSHDFGELPAGTVASKVLEVWNDGFLPLTLGGIGFDEQPGPFALGDGGCVTGLVLDPGWGCELEVSFVAPAVPGNHQTVVFVEADGGSEVALVLITGSSLVSGQLVAEPGSLDFGVVPRGATSASQSTLIRNVGGGPVALAAQKVVTTAGKARNHFDVTANQCAGVLAPGAACWISLTFSPSALPSHIGGKPVVEKPGQAIFEARAEVHMQNGTVLAVPLKGALPFVAPSPTLPKIDYGTIEQDLERLVGSVPRLMRGGPRGPRRLPAFKAPTAGQLSLQVRGIGAGRRGLLATGALELQDGQSKRLRFSLTRKARKLLRQPAKTRVKVTVVFTADATGEKFRQAPELTIRRPAKLKPRKSR